MIEKMKKVTVLSEIGRKHQLLVALRNFGVLHITDIVQRSDSYDSLSKEKDELFRIMSVLEDAVPRKERPEQKTLDDSRFDELHRGLLSLVDEKRDLGAKLIRIASEISRIEPFGDFDPTEIKALEKDGIEIHLYTLGKKELNALRLAEDVSFIKIGYSGKMEAVAVIGKPLDRKYGASEFILPSSSLADLQAEKLESEKRIGEIDSIIRDSACYISAYSRKLEKNSESLLFDRVSSTVEGTEIIYLSGYIPAVKEEDFKAFCHNESAAYLISDPTEEDNPPTLIRYNAVTKLVKPVFDLLGTIPGYREYDISMYFLIFFSLFFAMIIGDAGYGLLFLIGAIALNAKSRKCSDVNALLYVVSIVTIVWGAMTGTWFGSETILKSVPLLQKLVVPAFTNFPAVIGVDGTYAQNMMMKFCFMLGTIQLSLACAINIVHKIPEKNLSWVADLGWLIDVLVLYFLVLYLVIGQDVSSMFPVIIGGIALGFVLVTVFGSQAPGVKFSAGVKAGLAGFVTNFINTISCFSNIMSYIRLFAVGMASLAIGQSFNGMGAGLLSGFALPLGILVILIGHAMNIVMGILSVVVHGVRLNLLEFSGQLGMEWTGYNYEPFRKMVDDKVVANN